MNFNYLVVVIPMKWLPQNTELARTQVWAAVSQLLLANLGKLYARFYPAPHPWGQDIPNPLGIVLGREDPVTFLNLFYRAKKEQEDAVAFHSVKMLSNISPEQTNRVGDTLICHVTADGSNPALAAHARWHTFIMSGILLPDCGIYYLEQGQAMISPEQEKAVFASPADYALCAVTLEAMEGAA